MVFTSKILRQIHFLCVCVSLLATVGCRTASQIQFGMYSVPEKDLPSLQDLGMNFVVGRGAPEYIKMANEFGLKVIAAGPINRGTDHSAIGGIYLSDEPDLHDISPERVAAEYRAAKRFSRPVYLNLSAGSSAQFYSAYCDVLMFDWYPVGWQPLATFYSQLRFARLAVDKKPFYAVIQTFDWKNYPEVMPARSSFRKPTAAELKAMTIWAAMSGASGIAFYPFDDGHSRLTESPDLVAAIKESVQIVREHEVNFRSPRVWAPYPFDYLQRDDEYNEILEPSIAVKFSRVADDTNRFLLISANTTARAIRVTARPVIGLIGAEAELTFAPFEVKILFVRAP
jgi:hypothetical protein